MITIISISLLRGEGNYEVYWLNNLKIIMAMMVVYSTFLGYLPISLMMHFVGNRLAKNTIIVETVTFIVHSYVALCILYNQVIGLSALVDYSASRFLAWIAVLIWVISLGLWECFGKRGATTN